ncbi:MAG: DinB family protein [Planctomycetes bacterium]|nr:DinB family protein [Planctomycetota bacterium]
MKHDLSRSIEILSRTPATLRALLGGVSESWTMANYGPETFSPYDVVGHLIHGERADWITRAHWIEEKGVREPFPPFDRFAQQRESVGKDMATLLGEFEALRAKSLVELAALRIDEGTLGLVGRHPTLGTVTMRELLATWVVHDLDHTAQIARSLAYQYKDEVGPWRAYLPILPKA